MNDRQCPNELDWLAFCYAAGELDAAQAEQFEVRLADDQSAREALARAVELTQIVAAAESQSTSCVMPAAQRTTAWQARVSWMAVGGLAAALLAMLWSGVVGPTWRTAQRSLRAPAQQQLASAWYATRADINSAKESGVWFVSATASDTDDLWTEASLNDDNDDEAPSWLTAAVFSRSAETPDQPQQNDSAAEPSLEE